MFRSLLFIPGNNPSMLQNADIFMSDAIIFDLEDGVSMKDKDNARHLVDNYLITNQSLPKHICLRCNPVNSLYIDDDLQLLKSKKIDYLVLPKANQVSIQIIDRKLSYLEETYDLDEIKIIALIEEAKAILTVNEIACHKRVHGLLLGAEDLTNELGIDRTLSAQEILLARSNVAYAAAAYQILAIDTPFTDIDHQDALKEDCLNAKKLGMKAKAAIHPNQLDTINDVFSPDQGLIEWAKGLLEQEKASDKGVFQYQGKMVDKPIIEKAKKIIENAKKFNLM